ncbi:Glyoxylate/hydroxypyruvate reductase B [Paraburkholderia graminis C4D1M]|uniref:D-isomer specific 2-hydroxyacid dehydrogenase NAD-binding n=1 Tax=Paraburkholderia graminis (strain ATCC 700544 / DSM 17151 / LMG 18924 / NCIMB 13744 / C4D1M) TaxID=396598 RepID=B1G6J4_PARG4|nr:D-glycerate dehydrogenase [Paraburkholderia graminis]EDT08241.1 D-isomer specific 2-hydroxyacid dehydrogenase NAD-binding [Paraburkholderia graminis C4D1M]CAB3723595.1 Glyoxylate/hydroxypyruvate reductase B [Paraburkholderia graminis C4D1M]
MRKRIVAYRKLPAAAVRILEAQFDVTFVDADADRAAFCEALAGAHGAIGNKLKLGAELLDGAPVLEAVSTVSAGYDDFDVAELTRRGIVLCNTPDEVTETTADLVLALMLAAARRVAELDAWTRRGEWRASSGPAQFGVDVHHKTLGIVGLGRIGAAVARRAALGFGMNVLYSNRSRHPAAEQAYGAQWCPLPELLGEADFVCVLVPLSAATVKLIGAAELRLMKPSAILINCARGQVLDETALTDALREGRLLGAGLDVFEREPLPADSPLFALPNVTFVPHIGSATRQTREAMAHRAALNLLDALQGRHTATCVNPEALESRPQSQHRAV